MECPLWRLLISSRSVYKHGHHRQFLWSISKKSSSLKLPSHMNRNLVGSIYMYGRFCIKFPQCRMKGEWHRLSEPTEPLVSDCQTYVIINNLNQDHRGRNHLYLLISMQSMPITTNLSFFHPWKVNWIQLYVVNLSATYNRSVVTSTNKTKLHEITEILLKIALKHL
jgi:hypothetical protein